LAQNPEAKYTYSYGAEYFVGFIVQHHPEMGHLIQGHPEGLRLNFTKASYGAKAWEQRYNFPEFSASLSFYDLKNDDFLGKTLSINIGLAFHLNDFINRRGDFQTYFGYGLGYFNNVYDKTENNKNNVMSSHLPWSFNLRLGYWYKFNRSLRAGVNLQISHFSNASRNVPNFGLNVVNLNVGVRYQISRQTPEYLFDKTTLKGFKEKSYVNFDFRFGITQLKPVGTGASPYFAVSVFWNKRINAKSILDAGIEGFMNKAIQKQIEHNHLLIEGSPDYKALGIMIGHELMLEKLAIVTQLGVYVYKPYQPDDRIYTKVGLKYYFNKNVFASFILKSHYAVAEVMEYGIGYRF